MEEPYQLIKEGSNYRLKLKLPFISKKDVELSKMYEELVIRIGGYKRHVLLPRQVASLNSVTAKMEGEYLNIVFEGDDHGGEKE
jgi:arsenite-transporting ATPase